MTPVRRLLISAHERLSEGADTKLRGLLTAGDPQGEVRLAWHAKETLRGLYDIDCPRLADAYLRELTDNLTDTDCPPELSRLGRTLRRWHHQIINWHQARVTNGPTEAVNNLIKRVKRAAFGFRRFAHYRTPALLYAGKPMRVRIEVGSIGGDGSQTLAPPVVVAFQLSASPPMPAR